MSNEENDNDAICKRTRAQYSLASSTLDDLEAFLHETDDEDDDDNEDEEEQEYRKFLAATVSHSGEGDDGEVHDDDDEDSDVDFELQLEQALETDDDEETSILENKKPVTRRKRRTKISNDSRLLRPLVPIFPITQPVTRFYTVGGFFSQAQIRELHCLIHDHIQLLIQVYSLCAFDHSKQNIGTQVQGLISEMLQKQQRPSHVLDSVSPVLDLAGRYLVDVSSAVQDYRKCQVESGFEAMFERVPLFESGGGRKDDPVGVVHKDIAKLAKVFLPLFKVSLFPQNPPPGGKRSLFTSAEDELLALGIMEYNSDWKAIKQRFLPCKSEHQIFIRKKNKGASKASENPIKAVLRMKNLKKNSEVYLHEGFLEGERPPRLLCSATSMHSYENVRLESCTQRLEPCVFPLGYRKPHKKSVVRLASDLPLVSLPSSASVILPSGLAINQCLSGRENLSTTNKVNSSEKNDSGLVMHPLLFQTPEHGQITTCNTRGSCSSSFLSETRPKLLSLFNNSPREIDHSSALGDSCFHPFLRSSENLDSGIGKNAKLCQLEDVSGAVDNACIPVAGRNDGSQVPGSTATSRCIDEMGDHSNLGIVMEHEELSDSDQDMMEEENVEFECEEMTDSQGEDESECEGN
ncbi:unnamed protein product [Eruca vesicaria subsp. sativa]|uniref:Uncharacterized protein n=1 Tax=Eruca vesicaria subsp. sativa TaxID=29727 RepID=A0ABC8LIA3_ERUVS|nr:unnamed protein product [Eruca vesicaria subsp. sativa]